MILKEIAKVSFRNSEATNYAAAMRRRSPLKENEVLVLVSLSGDQIVFCYGKAECRYSDTYGATHGRSPVIHSERLRLLDGEKWTPDKLADIAKRQGIALYGLKLFEDWHGRKINTQRKK